MTDLAWMRPKLAELCGLQRDDVGGWYYPSTVRGLCGETVRDWRPDEDVAQALRCLEATNGYWDVSRTDGGYEAAVFIDGIGTHHAKDASIPHTICLAIAAAFGWEAPPP